ncbi:MAG: V-type ATP synthase subunit A, partial [Candidatus Firestonebacteria bacterium]|nr:V-type ATP synthase subunit A [Candidatus Firestonebacteria bacterium]
MEQNNCGHIIKVSGPLVVAEGMKDAKMYNVVKVSTKQLIGEIIELKGDLASIQVYEETFGLGVGDPVWDTGEPLSVELGPGLIESIYDGIQRPLDIIREKTGNYITRGISLNAISREKKWDFIPSVKVGEEVGEGDILGSVHETVLIKHLIMIPFGLKGKIKEINKGAFNITQTIAILETDEGVKEINMLRMWPVRKSFPVQEKLVPDTPLISGQRIIDSFFPVTKGGTACIPGPFGSGKTVVQQQLAKWADADIIVYIGCGERGNEITDVLTEFPELKDPKSGEPLMKRTIIIANTSNMPVAAREASVYTGVALGSYYMNMGYNIAVMADSTSRWAEAMREMSGRLEEMPGEEGYPAYLSSRIAEFYERAGDVICIGKDRRRGSLSIIGAVSPPGGDLSDPVVQSTLRVVKVFWGLEDKLAFRRHFPAINWLRSYSLYVDNIEQFMTSHVSLEFSSMRKEAMRILQQEAELEEIVRLVGLDSLSAQEKMLLETAKSIREDFLHQNAFDEQDTYTSIKKQFLMLKLIMIYHTKCQESVKLGVDEKNLINLSIRADIAKSKFISENNLEEFHKIEEKIKQEISSLENMAGK